MKVGARKNFNPTLDQFLDLMRTRATGFHGCYAHIHDEPVTTFKRQEFGSVLTKIRYRRVYTPRRSNELG
jgi:hypothetical protein